MSQSHQMHLLAHEAADRKQLTIIPGPAVRLPNGQQIPLNRLRYNASLGFFDRRQHKSEPCEVYGDK